MQHHQHKKPETEHHHSAASPARRDLLHVICRALPVACESGWLGVVVTGGGAGAGLGRRAAYTPHKRTLKITKCRVETLEPSANFRKRLFDISHMRTTDHGGAACACSVPRRDLGTFAECRGHARALFDTSNEGCDGSQSQDKRGNLGTPSCPARHGATQG